MSMDNSSSPSPFSALSYQEQQDRWLEWRSRQLDYRPVTPEGSEEAVPSEDDTKKGTAYSTVPDLPPLRMPNMAIAAPVRHRELDQVLSRHAQAAKRAGAFQPTATG